MKKIVYVPSQPERKIVGFLGVSGIPGYYTRTKSGEVWWHSSNGRAAPSTTPWEELMNSSRTKIYEGDSITITF